MTPFLYEVDAGIATITLNRPERLNALTFEVYKELRDTFQKLDTESGVPTFESGERDVRSSSESLGDCAQVFAGFVVLFR